MLNQSEQLVQDNELKLQFDGVAERVKNNFEREHVVTVDRNQNNVEDECDDLRCNQQPHDTMGLVRKRVLEKVARVPDVHQRYNRLLNTKPNDLDLLHHFHRHVPGIRVRARDPEVKNDNWRVQNDGICDDHGEDSSADAPVVDDQIKARI